MIKNCYAFFKSIVDFLAYSIFEQGGLGQRTEWTSLP